MARRPGSTRACWGNAPLTALSERRWFEAVSTYDAGDVAIEEGVFVDTTSGRSLLSQGERAPTGATSSS